MFKNIFYRFYSFFKYVENKLTPEDLRVPQYITVFFLMLLFMLNTGSFVLLFEEYLDCKIITNKMVIIIFIIFIYIVLYYSFIHKKKYLKIAEEYKKETKTKKVFGVLLSLIYIIFTVAFLVIVISKR